MFEFQVEGIEAVSLCASDSAVYALTGRGKVYRREGITELNFSGISWQEVPPGQNSGSLTSLTVTVCDQLYGVNKAGRVTEMLTKEIGFGQAAGELRSVRRTAPKISRDNVEGDWAVID